jgi:hypothetical protein
VSPPFTWLYLVYIVAFASAANALVLAVASFPPGDIFGDHAPRRLVGVFSLLVGTGLAVVWLKAIAARTAAGDFGWPVGVDAVSHVVRALDLGLQVPLAIAAGVLLLRRRAARDLVAGIFLVNATCMAGALTGMVAWATGMRSARPFLALCGISFALALAFFRGGHLRGQPSGRRSMDPTLGGLATNAAPSQRP